MMPTETWSIGIGLSMTLSSGTITRRRRAACTGVATVVAGSGAVVRVGSLRGVGNPTQPIASPQPIAAIVPSTARLLPVMAHLVWFGEMESKKRTNAIRLRRGQRKRGPPDRVAQSPSMHARLAIGTKLHRDRAPGASRAPLELNSRGTPLALPDRMQNQSNPWKWSFIAAVIGVPLTVLAFAGGARLLRSEPEAETRISLGVGRSARARGDRELQSIRGRGARQPAHREGRRDRRRRRRGRWRGGRCDCRRWQRRREGRRHRCGRRSRVRRALRPERREPEIGARARGLLPSASRAAARSRAPNPNRRRDGRGWGSLFADFPRQRAADLLEAGKVPAIGKIAALLRLDGLHPAIAAGEEDARAARRVLQRQAAAVGTQAGVAFDESRARSRRETRPCRDISTSLSSTCPGQRQHSVQRTHS